MMYIHTSSERFVSPVFTFIIHLFLWVLLLSCSKQQTSGTVSETTNGSVAGVITYDGKEAAKLVSIKLVSTQVQPYGENGVNGANEVEEYVLQSDASGSFSFEDIPPGAYSLYAIDTTVNQGLVYEVVIDSGAEVQLDVLTLQQMAHVFFVGSAQVEPMVPLLWIPQINTNLSVKWNGADTAYYGVIPAGLYEQIFAVHSSKNTPLLQEAITVSAGDSLYLHPQAVQKLFAPMGYYSYDYDIPDYASIGADTIKVQTHAELTAALTAQDTLVVLVHGIIVGSQNIRVKSHKKIIGISGAQLDGFGLRLLGVREITVQNISFINALEDAIEMDQAKRIWIDHCYFTGAADELVSVTHATDSITISWSVFSEHAKALLIGHSDKNESEDKGTMHVTLYANWFDGINGQAPRVRFGNVHIVNNLYTNIGEYAVASTMGAKVSLDHSAMFNVPSPVEIGYSSTQDGDLEEYNSSFRNCGAVLENGTVPLPAYEVMRLDVSMVPYTIRYGSGVVSNTFLQ
jgi:pectate lyase